MRKKIFLPIAALVLGVSCSDKYQALEEINQAPELSLSKDTLFVRINDTITKNSELLIKVNDRESNVAYLQIPETKGKIKVLFDRSEIFDGVLPFIEIGTRAYLIPVVEGIHALKVLCFDRMGRVGEKSIVVKTIPNRAPTAAILVTQLSGREYRIDGGASIDYDGAVIKYHFFIDNVEIVTSQKVINHIFNSPGGKTIKLKVEDDAGSISNFVTQTINVL